MKSVFSSLFLVLFTVLLNISCSVKIQGVDIGRVFGAAKKAVNLGDKDQEQELAIGEDTMRSLFGDVATLNNDEALQKYISTVGYWLARHSSRPALPWRFIVINDTAVNAFAAPGGYITITTGMLALIENEAELAGVLAHEIGHVVQRHHLNALQKKSQRGLLADLAILGAQASQASKDHSKQSDGAELSLAFDKVVEDLYYRGLDRDDEHKADQYGVLLVAKAGYDPYAFLSVLQKIGSREGKNEQQLKRFIRVHPSTSERLKYLETDVEILDRYELGGRVLAQRYLENTRI